MPAETRSNRGEVFRVASNTLAYLALDDQKTILSFTPSDVMGSDHRDFAELNMTRGLVLNVRWNSATAQIESAEYVAGGNRDDRSIFRADGAAEENYANLPHPEIAQTDELAQVVLPPDLAEKGRTVVRRAISPEVRAFGKVVDTSRLRAGDLMLSQDLRGDAISNLIAFVQGRTTKSRSKI